MMEQGMSDTTVSRTVSIEFNIGEDFLSDILTTACEGGIGYWSQLKDYDCDRDHHYIREYDDYSDEIAADHEWFRIDHDLVMKGLHHMMDPNFEVADYIRKYVYLAITESDAGHIDADAADCIIQAGVYGELVYG